MLVSEEAHVTISKALALLGLGRERVGIVPTDRQGRMLVGELPELDNRRIVCIQAGDVNTGNSILRVRSAGLPSRPALGSMLMGRSAFGRFRAVNSMP